METVVPIDGIGGGRSLLLIFCFDFTPGGLVDRWR